MTLVTSPVEGVVTEQHVTAGKPFDANQPLATVQNPNVDRALLIDLTGKKLDNQQREDAARAELAGDESQLASTEHDLQRYQSVAQKEHAATIRALEARLAVARAQVDQQEDIVNRNQAMQWAGAVSEAYTSASRYQLSILSNAKAAAAAELEHAVANGDASRSKVYASATDGPAASLSQRGRLLGADIAQRKAEIAQFDAYGQSVDKLIAAEQQRLDRLSRIEIRSGEPGVVEDVLAPPGTRVAAGATLIRASNCARSRVVAVFPRSLSDDLLPGTHLNVRMDGVPAVLPASIAEVLPRASEGEQARYFVPFPPIEKNEIYVIAKLDEPLAPLSRRASAQPDALRDGPLGESQPRSGLAREQRVRSRERRSELDRRRAFGARARRAMAARRRRASPAPARGLRDERRAPARRAGRGRAALAERAGERGPTLARRSEIGGLSARSPMPMRFHLVRRLSRAASFAIGPMASLLFVAHGAAGAEPPRAALLAAGCKTLAERVHATPGSRARLSRQLRARARRRGARGRADAGRVRL